MANASVRTINALHAKDPFAFTLMGGDNADSAQTNEVEWVLSILSGAPSVECDSGDDNDPVPGADNDGTAAAHACRQGAPPRRSTRKSMNTRSFTAGRRCEG